MDTPDERSPELVLAPHTTLRTAEFDEAEPGDLILDRADRRQHAKLVNAAVGALLERFRSPARLPDAIAAMARETGADPFDMLTQAAPVVQELRSAGILQPAGSDDGAPRRFEVGAKIGAYLIHHVLRRTNDTEVAMATDAAGRPVALKTTRAGVGAETVEAFTREIDIARRLSGTVAPRVIEVLRGGDAPVLVTEWVEGLPLDRHVRACCHDPEQAVPLAVRVADAFARVHEAGILHGDIRPSNILVDGHGQVRLLDFGLSQRADPEARKFSFELGYMEPEAASALRDRTLPALTAAGEVCSLALVLAEAIGGGPVRDLPPFRDDALKAISDLPPVIRTGLALLDAVLETATRPLPARTADMAGLREALAGLTTVRKGPVAPDMAPDAGATIDRAVLLLRTAEVRSDPEHLAAAQRSLRLAEGAERPGPDTASPLYTPVARALLKARIAYAARRFDQARAQLDLLPELLSGADRPADLFSGTAGDLAHLARFVADWRVADDRVAELAPVMDGALQRQLGHLNATLSGLKQGRPTHLGMAHGLAGQLHAILRTNRVLGRNMDKTAEEGLRTLARLAEPVGPGLAWRGTVGAEAGQAVTADFTSGWCSGTAGFLLLWIEAGRTDPDPLYHRLAEASAIYTLGHPDSTPNLCCGLAGRAIALAIHAANLRSEDWRERAQAMVDTLTPREMGRSIFRGQAGIDLARIEVRSRRPVFPI